MRKSIIGKVQPQYGEDIWHRIDEVDEIRYLIINNGFKITEEITGILKNKQSSI